MILSKYHNVLTYWHYFLWCNKHVLWSGNFWSNLTHMFITGWSMFQKCHLCIVPEPIWNCSHLWQPLPFFLFCFLNKAWLFGLLTDLTLRLPRYWFAQRGQCFLNALPLEKYGAATENMPFFLYFCSLSPDTHEMQWSLQFFASFCWHFFVLLFKRKNN